MGKARIDSGLSGWLKAALIIAAGALAASAAVIDVASLPELQTALAKAAPGDEIYLANGVYTSGGKITVTRQGTAALPILVSAKTIGGAEIKGSGGFTFGSPAIGKAVGSYGFVTVDMDGLARGSPLDVGADQYGNGEKPISRILTPADAGPDAVEGPVGLGLPGRFALAAPRVIKFAGAVVLPATGSASHYSVFDLAGRRGTAGVRKRDGAEGFHLLVRTGLDAN